MRLIRPVMSLNDSRIGTRNPESPKVPKSDIFGGDVEPPFSTYSPESLPGYYFIIPSRPLTDDESMALIDATKDLAVLIPNGSESAPAPAPADEKAKDPAPAHKSRKGE